MNGLAISLLYKRRKTLPNSKGHFESCLPPDRDEAIFKIKLVNEDDYRKVVIISIRMLPIGTFILEPGQ